MIITVRRQKQEDCHKFEADTVHIVRPYLKIINKPDIVMPTFNISTPVAEACGSHQFKTA